MYEATYLLVDSYKKKKIGTYINWFCDLFSTNSQYTFFVYSAVT